MYHLANKSMHVCDAFRMQAGKLSVKACAKPAKIYPLPHFEFHSVYLKTRLRTGGLQEVRIGYPLYDIHFFHLYILVHLCSSHYTILCLVLRRGSERKEAKEKEKEGS